MIEFCVETYGGSRDQWLENESWESIMYLLDARSRRMEKEKEQQEQEDAGEVPMNQIGDHQYGLGV